MFTLQFNIDLENDISYNQLVRPYVERSVRNIRQTSKEQYRKTT